MADTEYKSISDLESSKEIGGRSDWGNMLVVNTGRNPVINFAFMLRVEGVFDLPCKAVKGIRRENEFDYIQEGGLNDYVHLKRKAISKPFTFQVERYVGVNWIDPMPLGTELVLPLILFVNNRTFPDFKPVRNYVFTGCTVIAKDYGELNAEVSGLLVETVTIAYREMICLDIPNDALSGDTWEFSGKSREGSGKRHYNSNLYNKEWETQYNSKTEMERRAAKAKWKLKTDEDGKPISVYGKDYSNYATDFNEKLDKQIKKETDEEKKKELEETRIVMNAAVHRKYHHSKEKGDPTKMSAKLNKDEKLRSEWVTTAEEKRWKPVKDENGHLNAKYGRDYSKYVTDFNAKIDKQIEKETDEEKKEELKKTKIAMNGAEDKKYVHSKTPRKIVAAKVLKETKGKEMEETAEKERWQPVKDEYGHLNAKYGRDYKKYVTDFNAEIDKQIEKETDEEKKAELKKTKIDINGAADKKYVHSETPRKNVAAKVLPETDGQAMSEKASLYIHSKVKGDPSTSAAKHIENEASREDFEKKASLYKHSRVKGDPSTSAAKHIENEASRASFEEKASLYKHSREKGDPSTSAAKHIENEASRASFETKASLYKHSKVKGDPSTSAAKHIENEASRASFETKASLYKHSEVKGDPSTSAAKHNEDEASRADFEKKANLYKHSEVKGDPSTSAAKHNDKEASKAELEKKASLYKHSAAKGNPSTSAAKHNDKEASKAELEKKASLYKHSEDKGDPANSSAKHIKDELSKQQMEQAHKLWPESSMATKEPMKTPEARLWPRTKSAKQITDFLNKH